TDRRLSARFSGRAGSHRGGDPHGRAAARDTHRSLPVTHHAVTMRLLAAALLLGQSADSSPRGIDRAELRAGLDTLYAGDFETAGRYFSRLTARDTTDPAPLVFHAGAYIWWAAARDSDDFASTYIDSLLDAAIEMAQRHPEGRERDFWLATALGYRA